MPIPCGGGIPVAGEIPRGNEIHCGEGACSRWAAQQPQKAKLDQHDTPRWPGSGRGASCPRSHTGWRRAHHLQQPPIPVGASLLAMKSTRFQTKTSHPHRRQTLILQTLATHLHQPTHPCAFAYNYARIRPLVRLVPGFYCFPATAHQWSGLVARGNRSCTSTSQTGPYPVLDGGCTQGA